VNENAVFDEGYDTSKTVIRSKHLKMRYVFIYSSCLTQGMGKLNLSHNYLLYKQAVSLQPGSF